MVRPARFRAICSAFGDVEARPHFDRTAFRTPARTFATLGPTEKDVNVLVPLELQEMLVDTQPAAFTRVSGAWGARGWTRMELASVDEVTCREVLREAYALAAPTAKPKGAKKTASRGNSRSKAKSTPKAKAPNAKAKPKSTSKAKDDELGALEEILGPTLRAYAEEEARILELASQHPKLGATFVEAMAKSDAAVPRKYRAAFLEAVKNVDVPARANAVVKKMEKYWGTRLDAETKKNVRADVAAMYRGAGATN